MSDGRKLRSKDVAQETPGLFDFDNINGLLHFDHRISIRRDIGDKENPYKHFNVEMPKLAKHSLKVVKLAHNFIPRKSRFRDDPLDDLVYEAFHKKMRKQELSMARSDSTRILLEVDTLQNQLLQLRLDSWVRHLPSICKVNDVKDLDEMNTKKELAIAEINRLLHKFSSWKKRQEDLKTSIKHFSHYYDNPEGDKEYDMTLEELKEIRRHQRFEKYGPTIKLKLNNGYILLCDPVCPPRLVRDLQTPLPTQKQEEETTARSSTSTSISRTPSVSPPPKVIVRLNYSKRQIESPSPTDPDSPLSVVGDLPERTLESFVDELYCDFPNKFAEDPRVEKKLTRLKSSSQKRLLQSTLQF